MDHEHPLIQEPSSDSCKVCNESLGGTAAYVCRQCPLILCYNCGKKIYLNHKDKQVHPHPLSLKFRYSWKCDICKTIYKYIASFYCMACDFDVCTKCYCHIQ